MSGVLPAFATKWYPPTGVQIEKDLIDLIWVFLRDNEDALRLSLLPCNFAAWQVHLWSSTAELEAFSAGRRVFCKMLENIAAMRLPSHLLKKDMFLGALIGPNCVGCNSEQFFQELKVASRQWLRCTVLTALTAARCRSAPECN